MNYILVAVVSFLVGVISTGLVININIGRNLKRIKSPDEVIRDFMDYNIKDFKPLEVAAKIINAQVSDESHTVFHDGNVEYNGNSVEQAKRVQSQLLEREEHGEVIRYANGERV